MNSPPELSLEEAASRGASSEGGEAASIPGGDVAPAAGKHGLFGCCTTRNSCLRYIRQEAHSLSPLAPRDRRILQQYLLPCIQGKSHQSSREGCPREDQMLQLVLLIGQLGMIADLGVKGVNTSPFIMESRCKGRGHGAALELIDIIPLAAFDNSRRGGSRCQAVMFAWQR